MEIGKWNYAVRATSGFVPAEPNCFAEAKKRSKGASTVARLTQKEVVEELGKKKLSTEGSPVDRAARLQRHMDNEREAEHGMQNEARTPIGVFVDTNAEDRDYPMRHATFDQQKGEIKEVFGASVQRRDRGNYSGVLPGRSKLRQVCHRPTGIRHPELRHTESSLGFARGRLWIAGDEYGVSPDTPRRGEIKESNMSQLRRSSMDIRFGGQIRPPKKVFRQLMPELPKSSALAFAVSRLYKQEAGVQFTHKDLISKYGCRLSRRRPSRGCVPRSIIEEPSTFPGRTLEEQMQNRCSSAMEMGATPQAVLEMPRCSSALGDMSSSGELPGRGAARDVWPPDSRGISPEQQQAHQEAVAGEQQQDPQELQGGALTTIAAMRRQLPFAERDFHRPKGLGTFAVSPKDQGAFHDPGLPQETTFAERLAQEGHAAVLERPKASQGVEPSSRQHGTYRLYETHRPRGGISSGPVQPERRQRLRWQSGERSIPVSPPQTMPARPYWEAPQPAAQSAQLPARTSEQEQPGASEDFATSPSVVPQGMVHPPRFHFGASTALPQLPASPQPPATALRGAPRGLEDNKLARAYAWRPGATPAYGSKYLSSDDRVHTTMAGCH